MKILVVCQYFYPEEFKVNDLVEGLVARGHHVTVLTGKPNYPHGEFYPGYSFGGVIHEQFKGANVIRVPLIRRGNSGTIRLLLNYLSFALFGNLYVLFHNCDYDSVMVYQLSPITMAYPAILAKRKCGASMALYVQDLWPESVSATSAIKGGIIMRALNGIVKRIYKKANTILVQSKAFEKSICSKGDFKDKIVYAPNWAEDVFVDKSLINKERYKAIMPCGFKVMFAGNIGEAQDFENILNAANLTKNDESIKWIIIGDGRARAKAEDRVKKEGLDKTVFFWGRYPISEMPSFFCHADAMLVSLKREYIFSLTIPTKIQAYMAAGKPILTMVDGEGGRVVNDAECGMTAPAEDYHSLSNNIIKMRMLSEQARIEMGQKGQSYYNQHFAKESVINLIERSFVE